MLSPAHARAARSGFVLLTDIHGVRDGSFRARTCRAVCSRCGVSAYGLCGTGGDIGGVIDQHEQMKHRVLDLLAAHGCKGPPAPRSRRASGP